jgi:hypothetical protein
MEWTDFVSQIEFLPRGIPRIGQGDGPPLLVIEEDGIAVRSGLYQRIEELTAFVEAGMESLDLLPSIEGWHPKDVFGKLAIELGEWTLMWPVSVLLLLVVFKLKGWLIELKYESVTEDVAVEDVVETTVFTVE